MKSTRFMIPALALALFASAGTSFAQQRYGQPEYRYDNGNAGQAFEQRGFRDGTQGADRDYQNHRRPDVNNRDEYRNPNFIPRWGQREYREAFRRAYYLRVKQVYNGENRGYRDNRGYGENRGYDDNRGYGNGYGR